MSGLLISLKPNETFLVNGVLLANGPKRAQIRVPSDDVHVLRVEDVLHPDRVRTPVTRLYHAVQTIMSGDRAASAAKEEVESRFASLEAVLAGTRLAEQLDRARQAWARGRLYSALNCLRTLIPIEAELLGHASLKGASVDTGRDMACAVPA